MKVLLAVVLALLCTPGVAGAQPHDDVAASPSCKHCGMDREKFAHSRMLIRYEDGSTVGLCSVRCAAVELAGSIDRSPKAIQVGDRATKKLIDAETAVWVIGGNEPGVMTARAKWAFESRAAAEAFVKTSGGTIATFDEVMKAAYEDMYQDTKMIRERRRMKRSSSTGGSAPTPAPASVPR